MSTKNSMKSWMVMLIALFAFQIALDSSVYAKEKKSDKAMEEELIDEPMAEIPTDLVGEAEPALKAEDEAVEKPENTDRVGYTDMGTGAPMFNPPRKEPVAPVGFNPAAASQAPAPTFNPPPSVALPQGFSPAGTPGSTYTQQTVDQKIKMLKDKRDMLIKSGATSEEIQEVNEQMKALRDDIAAEQSGRIEAKGELPKKESKKKAKK